MSATKIGKIIAEQSKLLLDQRDKIRKIYNPNNLGIRSSSNNIRANDQFPSIKNKNLEKAINSSFTGDTLGQRSNNLGEKLSYSSNRSKEWKKRGSKANLAYSDSKKIENEVNNHTGIRKQAEVSDLIRTNWNDINSLSFVGNMGGTDWGMIERAAKENATMSIKAKKQMYPQWYEQSLSNNKKYDTTVVMSEKLSGLEMPFTQMYTYSILSNGVPDRNIEELHYIRVKLWKGLRRLLEKTESTNDKNNEDASPQIKNKSTKGKEDEKKRENNLMKMWEEEIIE